MTSSPAAAVRPRRRLVVALLRDAARLDRTQSDPVVAARNALGVAAPLAIGVLSGGASLGLSATIGALQTAFADRPGPYRLRVLRMLATALAAGVTSGLAVLASRSDLASVALLAVLAFLAGLLLAGGPSATQTGVASVAAALIIGHLSQPPSAALHVGLLVAAGGTVQSVLAIAAWPLRRHRPERLALAALYRDLAAAARAAQGSRTGPPAGPALTGARQTLYGLGHDHGPSVEAYRVLLDEAERIRREIVVIVSFAERLAAEHDPILAGWVRESLTIAGTVLDGIAGSLDAGRVLDVSGVERSRAALRRAVDRLENDSDSDGTDVPHDLTRLAVAARIRALSGQLGGAAQSTSAGAGEGRRGEERVTGITADLLRNPVAVLRANLALDSTVLRHAVRLAVFVAGTDAVVRTAGIGRGYWVSLTVLVVLRPDFGATFQRAVARTVGTVVGLLVATELVRIVPAQGWWQVALIAAFAFGMRLAGPGNVGLSALSLSGLVVVLLEINGVPAHTTLVSRALATLAGGVVAVLASLALPAWERRFLPGRLAALLGAYRDFVLTFADPDADRADRADRAARQRARAGARLARTNAQASLDRARAEPVVAQPQIELAQTVLAHSHRFIHAMLALDAVRVPVFQAPGLPELTQFLSATAEVLGTLQADLAGHGGPPAGVGGAPPTGAGRRSLRPAQERLAVAALGRPERLGGVGVAATVVDASDRIANSLDTLTTQLRRYRVAPAPARPVSVGDGDRRSAGGRVSGPGSDRERHQQ